jgi:predicted SprT family Zn-dependent metalloprotease
MNRNELHRLARTLMDEHGLTTWKVKFGRSKSTAGRCFYGQRTIEMSEPLALVRTDESTRMTVLHEIAHALVGPGHNHDWVWRDKCLAIGGNGLSKYVDLAAEDRAKISRYTGTCPNGHLSNRQAKSARMFDVSCGKCARVYDPRFSITWTDNQTGRILTPPTARPRTNLQINWNQVAANQARRVPVQPARPASPPRTVGSSNPDDLWGTGD